MSCSKWRKRPLTKQAIVWMYVCETLKGKKKWGEEQREREKIKKHSICVVATINIYQSSYIQQSGHRRRTWQVKKKMPLLRTTMQVREKQANCYDPENISPNTTRHIEWTTVFSSEEEYYRTRHDFWLFGPTKHDTLVPSPNPGAHTRPLPLTR